MLSLKVENISFGYNSETEILSDISFGLENGEVLCILGPNGTGKTTLLKCINHIIEPKKGRVLVDGEDVAKFSPSMRAK